MPNLTRSPRSTIRPRTGGKTKVLLVRQPVKSVRQSDQPDRTSIRLAIGVIVAVGVIAIIWLMGFLGFRLGFAPMIRVPDLVMAPGGGLATGAMMLIVIPQSILIAGIAEPGWLMVGFAIIALPAAGLSAARPARPGGPRPPTAYVAMAVAGAIAAALNAIGVIWWSISPMRFERIGELPSNPADATVWLQDLQIVAGLDVLAMIAAALWMVLSMRLPVPLWLRSLVASTTFFALAVVGVAMSMTNASVAQVSGNARSLCVLDEASGMSEWGLLLGTTDDYTAILGTSGDQVLVRLRDKPSDVTAIGTESIRTFLEQAAPDD